jgi:ubiquinone/menaquinone biosynthesis C-methylase UbiE
VASGEVDRIRAEYADRERRLPNDQDSLNHPHNLFACQQKSRLVLKLLAEEGVTPLKEKTVLDVGCGDGYHLLEFLSWGANRSDLAGIDLLDARVDRARTQIGSHDGAVGPDLRVGDASRLPWPDETFDIVHQGTVFTSILDRTMKEAVAGEMIRVLKPNGIVIWYDFLFDNPWNPSVRGVGAREVRSLFAGCSVRLKRVTLAPPIARRSVPISWIVSLMLEKLRLLNTHYLGIIRKNRRPSVDTGR